jgi:hypothetical protein
MAALSPAARTDGTPTRPDGTPAHAGVLAHGPARASDADRAMRPAPPPAAAAPATLVITVDAPAIIAVDGHVWPLGRSATVAVQSGVPHLVTARRPGHSLHTLHVPAPRPGERLPLTLSLR